MNTHPSELPSNRSFGLFFVLVCAIAAAYFYNHGNTMLGNTFLAASSIFLATTALRDNLLLPLNRLWMTFGHLLGKIVSPLLLGIIFFGLFTPIAIVMRICGRDELRIRLSNKSSYWIPRSRKVEPGSLENQSLA